MWSIAITDLSPSSPLPLYIDDLTCSIAPHRHVFWGENPRWDVWPKSMADTNILSISDIYILPQWRTFGRHRCRPRPNIPLWVFTSALFFCIAIFTYNLGCKYRVVQGSCTVTGWGTLSSGGSTPNVLMKVPCVQKTIANRLPFGQLFWNISHMN